MRHLLAFALVILFAFPAFAVDVILTAPNRNAFMSDTKLWATQQPPVQRDDDNMDRLGSVFFWFGRADIAITYMVPYTLVDGTYDDEGNVITPPVMSQFPYIYIRLSEDAWKEMVTHVNPANRMPGGTEIIYAWGLTGRVDPDSPGDLIDTTFGILPPNGLRHSF